MVFPEIEPTKDPNDTNKRHSPLPKPNTDSLVKERTNSTKNNRVSSGFSNLDLIILPENGPKDTILPVESTKRQANTSHGPDFNSKQSPICRCMSLLVANEYGFDQGDDSDGEIGPFFGAVEAEGDQLFEEFPQNFV